MDLCEITTSDVRSGIVACEFCRHDIHCETGMGHYYVDGIGAMCRSCASISHITLIGERSYITTMRASLRVGYSIRLA
jgi:hypothetical protein